MKRTVFATFGSLGHVYPYAAIALELKNRGHSPVIVTIDMHRDAIEAAGIEFAPMGPNAEQLGDPADPRQQRNVCRNSMLCSTAGGSLAIDFPQH